MELKVRDIMSTPVISGTPEMSILEAATVMRDRHIGILALVADGIPVGVVTDRDIVNSTVPFHDRLSRIPVARAMQGAPITCDPETSVAKAAAIMGDRQVRRLLVVTGSGRLVGILSLGDIAENASEALAGEALGEIVEARFSPRDARTATAAYHARGHSWSVWNDLDA